MNARALARCALAAAAALLATAGATAPPHAPAATIARGRELVVYGTCNDCHTAGWRDTDGAVPVTRWLTGSAVGFRGWWGTSYATNVRLDFQVMTEDRWVGAVRTRGGHPPMVWQDLRQLSDADLGAIYQFVKSLGPAGVAMPAAIEPWREPKPPYIDMRSLPSPPSK